MNKLAINEVGGSGGNTIGFPTLFKSLNVKTEDSIEKNVRQARQSVRARKADEALQSWLRQLRDRGYVEFRTEKK